MPTRNINLSPQLDRFVEKQISGGQFQNASEVLRAGLRLLERQTEEDKAKLKVLRALAAEGFRQIDQGQGIEIKSDQELTALIAEISQRAGKRAKAE